MEWNCTLCGRCCNRWNIEIDHEDTNTLQKLGYDTKEFLDMRKGKMFLRHKNSHCLFLTDDNKCRIQADHGYKFKPKICRQFPSNKDNSNSLVCGIVTDIGKKENIQIDNSKSFLYKNKIIPIEVFLYSMGKINPNDYANQWYSVLKGIKNSSNKIICKDDIDRSLKKYRRITNLQKLRLKMMLSGYTLTFYPALFLNLTRKFHINFKFPCEKFNLKFNELNYVSFIEKDMQKFLGVLSSGHGVLYKDDYPEHLLFCFFFLEDFAKQIAYNNKKERTDVLDILNAFSMLNGTLRFS